MDGGCSYDGWTSKIKWSPCVLLKTRDRGSSHDIFLWLHKCVCIFTLKTTRPSTLSPRVAPPAISKLSPSETLPGCTKASFSRETKGCREGTSVELMMAITRSLAPRARITCGSSTQGACSRCVMFVAVITLDDAYIH